MNQNKHVVRVLSLTVPIFACIGILGAIYLTLPVNPETFVPNTEVQDGEREGQDVVDSQSVGPSRQNSLNLDEHSLFHALREYDNHFDLKRSLLRLIDEATEGELIEIFHESREYPLAFDSIQTTHWLRSTVLSKLLDIDGDTVESLIEQLDEQTAEVLVYGVMQAWNQMYLDKAVKFLDLFDSDLREQGLLGLVDGSTSLDRANFIKIGTELGFLEDYLIGLLDRSQLAQDQMSLEDIATELKNFISNGYAQFHKIFQQIENYVLEEGLDSLPQVLKLFDEQSVENMPYGVGRSFDRAPARLVSEISRSDPGRVFEYLVSLGEPLDFDLLSAVSEVWFATDPQALWNRLKDEDLRSIHDEVTQDLISGWVLEKPDFVIVSLDQFPSEYKDLVYAEVALQLVKESPLEALELLRETSDWSQTLSDRTKSEERSDRTLRYHFSIRRTIANATRADPISVIEWIESEQSNLDESMKQYFVDVAFKSWAGSDPHTAFEMALQTPLTTGSMGFEATVVGWVARQDVDQAIKLLPRVREGETKLAAYLEVMWLLEEQDSISQALHLGSNLPDLERKEYNESLAWQIGYREPFDHLIAGIRALPSQELQSLAIRSRLYFTYFIPEMAPNITNKQLDQFKEFLTDSEKRLLEMARHVYADRISEE